MNPYDVIQRPLITEKSVAQQATNTIAFRVAVKETKTDIRQAVESLFKVKVAEVRTMQVDGKYRKVGRSTGYRADWKKALVTLREGERLE
ncbi:MAG: 50S ribosomal protein L23, partial [Deltaproteobacteria bacterium]|nr:50S ribosomal protein L23 [Deltaproteobacteria bacterium]